MTLTVFAAAFNHYSPRRGETIVTRKITQALPSKQQGNFRCP